MALTVGAALAIGKAAVGVGKMIKSKLDSKKSGGAGLVDPKQSAMVNLMHRKRRAMETGTDDAAARGNLAKAGKNITKRSILGGKRDLSDFIKIQSAGEQAIVEGKASERLGMLKNTIDETRNIADREMDLLDVEKERKELNATAAKSTATKNATAQIPALSDALGGADKSVKDISFNPDRKKKKEARELKKANKKNKIGGGFKNLLNQGKELIEGLKND